MSTTVLHTMLNISETEGPTIGNSRRGIKWSRDRRRHVTLKGQTSDPNMLKAQYHENSCR